MFSNKSRWVAAALATVMSAGVLAGVAPANAATKTLVIWADESRGPILKSLLFGKTPVAGYKITVKAFSSLGALDTAFAAATRATGPDIVFSNAGLASVGGKSGKLQPLNLPASVRSQFGAKSFQALSYNSKVYGLPIDVDTTALFWNKAKFGKKAPTTLPQMVTHYKNNKVSKGYTAGICIPDSVWGAQSLITAMGGSAWNYDSKGNPIPNSTKINSAAFKANFTSLFMTNGESNGFYKEGGCFNDFLDGKIPFANTGGWNYAPMESANLNVGVTQLPGMTAGKFGSPWTGYQAVYVTKFAGQNGKGAGAMSFAVRYMSSANIQAALGSASDRPPANLAAAKLLKNPVTLGLAKAGSAGVLQLSPMLNNETAGSNWYALVPGAFNDILVDGDPVGATLDTLATKVKQNFVAGSSGL